MIVQEDIHLARQWLEKHCDRAHIRATLGKGLAYLEALERAGLCVESIDGADLHAFLTDAAETPPYRKHFVQPQL
jgi:hypothetical protein